MKMPGFSAEASLHRNGRYRSQVRTVGSASNNVVPAIPSTGWSSSCIPTSDGGLWCCVRGPNGPICWHFPPPPIIVALSAAA